MAIMAGPVAAGGEGELTIERCGFLKPHSLFTGAHLLQQGKPYQTAPPSENQPLKHMSLRSTFSLRPPRLPIARATMAWPEEFCHSRTL